MRAPGVVALVLVVCALPSQPRAWGMDVHRLLTRRVIDGLPADVRPLFLPARDFISEHSVDPDLWRVVALKSDRGAEDPNHFLDIDGLDEPAPFTRVPREWDAYVARYGVERTNQNGRLPWRVDEIFERLVASLRSLGAQTRPAYALDNARYLAAVLAHYIEDAFVPLHATVNHDGQLTGQRGLHARFETALVMRNLPRLPAAPVVIERIDSPRDFIFRTLVEGQALVAGLLDADRRADDGRGLYDDIYFSAFWRNAGPMLERRMNAAVNGVASAIVSAWERAGRPAAPIK